jgi:outer membrane receptor for ferrienterochelin and colicins
MNDVYSYSGRMRLVLILLFIVAIQGIVLAQPAIVEIRDSTDNTPLRGATLRFTCLDGACSDSTAGRRSDRFGRALSPFDARVMVVASYAGRRAVTDTLRPGETRVLLLPITSAEPIVVTAQMEPTEAGRSLYKVKVFDRQRIETQGASTLRDLLSFDLNSRVSQDNILGSSLSIQGLSGENVKVLVDGVPLIGRVNGNIDLSQVTLHNAERVEVIEGPLSVLYGTDALGGVVNIITRTRVENDLQFEANTLYESVGTYNVDALAGYRVGASSLLIAGGRNLFDGYSIVDTSRYLQWKPREQYFADVKLAHHFEDATIRYTGRYFNEYILNRGEPRLPYRESAFDDTYRSNRLTNTLESDLDIGNGRVAISGSDIRYRRIKNTFRKNLVTLEEIPTSEPSDHDTTRWNMWMLRGSYTRGDRDDFLNYQLGLDFSVEQALGGRIAGGEKEMGDYAFYASLQLAPIPEITLQPAMRYGYNTRYPAPVIPSLNLKAELASDLSLRASYARGFRAPSLRDLYFYFVDINHNIQGNEELRAEHGHSFNLSALYAIDGETSRIEIEPALFYNDITDLIMLANVDGSLYSYINIGEYSTLGGSFSTGYRSSDMTLRIGASYTGTYNDIPKEHGVSSYSFSPEIFGSAHLPVGSLPATLDLLYKYTGKRPFYVLASDGTPREGFMDGYHTLDLSASYNLAAYHLRATFGAKNLLDVRNVRMAYATEEAHSEGSGESPVGWGRTFYATLRFGL